MRAICENLVGFHPFVGRGKLGRSSIFAMMPVQLLGSVKRVTVQGAPTRGSCASSEWLKRVVVPRLMLRWQIGLSCSHVVEVLTMGCGPRPTPVKG